MYNCYEQTAVGGQHTPVCINCLIFSYYSVCSGFRNKGGKTAETTPGYS